MRSIPATDTDRVLVEELRAALSPERVHDDGLELALYGRDASLERGDVAVVCFPTSTDEVQAAIRLARRHGRPFVARGAGTGLAGGAVPRDRPIMVITTRMNRLIEIDV